MKKLNQNLKLCCTLDISGDDEKRLVNMFKALGNKKRFEILKFLLTRPNCITGEVVLHASLAQSTVSEHLKVLREAGWIKGKIDGPAKQYCLNKENIEWFKEKTGKIF